MEQPHQSEVPKASGIRTKPVEVVVATLLLILGAVYVFDSYRTGASWAEDGPESGYFPFYIGLIVCISSLVTLVQVVTSKAAAGDKIFVEWSALRQVLAVLLPAALYVLGIQLIGIYVSSALYIAIFMIWLGKYSWLKSIVIGVAVSLICFMLFEIWFQVPLYKGAYDPLSLIGL
jgi:hypothetical protein